MARGSVMRQGYRALLGSLTLLWADESRWVFCGNEGIDSRGRWYACTGFRDRRGQKPKDIAEMDYDLTRQVLEAFEREGVEYVIFGAVAVNLQGLARATEDLDVFIAPQVGNVERLRIALRSVFDDPNIEEITAEDLLGDYPAVQYVPPASRSPSAPTDSAY
jgi:hypothetical protein